MNKTLGLFALSYFIVGMFLIWVMLVYLDHTPAAARIMKQVGLTKAMVWLLLFWPHALLYCVRKTVERRRDG